jgi:hypothetical protein
MCVVVILIFVSSVLCCAPSRVCLHFVFLSAIFCLVYLCPPPPSSRFFVHLQTVIDPHVVCHPRVGFRLLIGVCFTLARAFI